MIFKLLGFFFVGVLLSLTPCVLPMIPIMVSILVGGDRPLTGTRACLLAVSFTFTSAVCYAVLGVVGGLTGTFIQGTLQTPYVIIPMAILLVLMALIQIDIVVLPLTTNDLLAKLSIKRNSIIGAGLLGIISVATLSPCVTPALVGVVSWISMSGHPTLGGIYLFIMGLGMGMPLILLTLIGKQILPKPGKYMNIIRYISATTLIGMSIFMVAGVVGADEVPNVHSVALTKEIKAHKVLIFVTSPTCHYCESVEEAIRAGAANGWDIQRVASYPGTFGTPNLIKVVNGKVIGKLVGGPRTFDEIKQFLNS